MNKPLLLLDIDGTLNLGENHVSPLSFEPMDLEGHFVNLCQDHGEWIDSLLDLYDAVWCSSWGENSNLIAEALNIPNLDYVPVDSSDPTPLSKLNSVHHYVGDQPFVWVDDHFNEDAHIWVEERNLKIPSLLVEVDSSVGLEKNDFQLIVAFWDYLYGDDKDG